MSSKLTITQSKRDVKNIPLLPDFFGLRQVNHIPAVSMTSRGRLDVIIITSYTVTKEVKLKPKIKTRYKYAVFEGIISPTNKVIAYSIDNVAGNK